MTETKEPGATLRITLSSRRGNSSEIPPERDKSLGDLAEETAVKAGETKHGRDEQ